MTHIKQKKTTIFYTVNILQLEALDTSCWFFFFKLGHDQAQGRQFQPEYHQVQAPAIRQNTQGSASGGKSECAQTNHTDSPRLAQQLDTSTHVEVLRISL